MLKDTCLQLRGPRGRVLASIILKYDYDKHKWVSKIDSEYVCESFKKFESFKEARKDFVKNVMTFPYNQFESWTNSRWKEPFILRIYKNGGYCENYDKIFDYEDFSKYHFDTDFPHVTNLKQRAMNFLKKRRIKLD